jgi:F-type H+-transporting ATPase subunit delta
MREIVARRYAKALIQIGREDGNYEKYGRELRAFAQVFDASADLQAVMENPIYDRGRKKALFKAINKKMKLSGLVGNFILLLIDKRRMGYFKDIVRSYEKLMDEVAGRVRAQVVSAISLPQESVKEIRDKLQSMTGKEVIVTLQEDPELIGGIITKIGDMVYDGSIRTQIEGMKESLLKR